MSVTGLTFAICYAAFAIFVVVQERKPSTGGNWITLPGMASFIVTLPVSGVCELMGAKLDSRKNTHMALAVGGCALLVYCVGAGAEWLFSRLPIADLNAPRS